MPDESLDASDARLHDLPRPEQQRFAREVLEGLDAARAAAKGGVLRRAVPGILLWAAAVLLTVLAVVAVEDHQPPADKPPTEQPPIGDAPRGGQLAQETGFEEEPVDDAALLWPIGGLVAAAAVLALQGLAALARSALRRDMRRRAEALLAEAPPEQRQPAGGA